MNKNNKLKNIAYLSTLGFGAYKLFKVATRKAKRENLKNQVIVITGASSGIGKSYAYAFAELGANIVLAARSKDKIEQLAKEIEEKYQVKTLAIQTDVSVEEQAKNLIDITLEHFDNIDILINNAGVAGYNYIHESKVQDMKKIMDINYWGMVYCTYSVLPSMIRRRKGRIVNISSVVGKRAMPIMGAYSASKFAMEGFSESLRVEVKKFGIGVTVICPTTTKTDIVNNAFEGDNLKIGSIGMSSDRVAKETINAILDNKREHILGFAENIGLKINNTFPSLVDNVLTIAPKFMLGEK